MRTDARTFDFAPLTPDRLADVTALFEEGGDPKWCWYLSPLVLV